MEKSIKRVENLVHVTNSALAQMKFSLMFDDVNGVGDRRGKHHGGKTFEEMLGENFLDGDDLKRCQNEFKAEANEMLAKMETMFGSNEFTRKNSRAVDRIKEINRKMNHLRLEQSKPSEETEQSRQKLLNLISDEKFSSGVPSSKESGQSKNTPFDQEKKPGEKACAALKKTDSTKKSPEKSKEELKSKILETQEIVNRGFKTARQLVQKVETISKCDRKEKTPSTDKTVSEINLRNLEERVESNETASSIKCKKRGKERKQRKTVDPVNARVIDIKRKETEVSRRSNLQLQRLPSLDIRGGLQLQKIHNLEIPAGGHSCCAKSNTAINFLSHEQVENEKMGEMIEKLKKENCCCAAYGDSARGNYVECFNCGKWIRIRETRVDPRKVDEILQKCNFNVFDPRIDEFVEKIGTGATMDWNEKTQPTDPEDFSEFHCDPPVPKVKPETREIKNEEKRPKRDVTLRNLSDQLLRKYKQEADTIESNHQKLDSILQNLFRQVDESRDVFESCSFFRNKRSDSERGRKLTSTKPVVVNLTGTSFRMRKKQRKLRRTPVNYISTDSAEVDKVPQKTSSVINYVENERLRGGISSLACASSSGSSESERRRDAPRKLIPSSAGSKRHRETRKAEEGASSSSTSISSNIDRSKKGKEGTESANQHKASKQPDRISRKEETERNLLGSCLNERKTFETAEMKKGEVEKNLSVSLSSSSSMSRCKGRRQENVQKARGTSPSFQSLTSDAAVRNQPVTTLSKSEGKALSETSSEKSENNYESDFESMTNEPNEIGDECEEKEPEGNPCINKLSTISEVDSELEKKLSDEQKTLRSSRNTEVDDTSESRETEPRNTHKQKEEVVPSKQKNSDPRALETSSESKKTELKTGAEVSAKSTPTELVTSLKDILSALQDQFLRTESLAEKLTENAKSESGEKTEGIALGGNALLSPWKMPTGAKMVENLRSARKDSKSRVDPPGRSAKSKPPAEGKGFSADSLSDEGGSSLGEIVTSDRRRKNSGSSTISECSSLRLASARRSTLASDRREASTVSAFKLDLNSEEGLYSEGEIPSDELLAYERFTNGSLGELTSKCPANPTDR